MFNSRLSIEPWAFQHQVGKIDLGDPESPLQLLDLASQNQKGTICFFFFQIRKLPGVTTYLYSFFSLWSGWYFVFHLNPNEQNCSGHIDKHNPLTISLLTNTWLILTLFLDLFSSYSQRRFQVVHSKNNILRHFRERPNKRLYQVRRVIISREKRIQTPLCLFHKMHWWLEPQGV